MEERKITKEEVQTLCEKAYAVMGEGDDIDVLQLGAVLKATQGISDLICNEVVNPANKEKMPFLILSLRQVLLNIEKSSPLDAALAAVLSCVIGSRPANREEDAGEVLAAAMRAMEGQREE